MLTRKEVSFEAGKALLSRINGEYFATSHLCPHYKAPLVKGTITTDGRVMCPWHGACFRVQTGDIEDAPSVDHLQSFNVIVRSGKVFISANAQQVKAGKRAPVCTKKVGHKETTIIVGGGAGGLITAESLRQDGYAGKIVIISRETYLPIDRPKLSKGIKIDAAKIALRTADDLKELNIDIELGTQVVSVSTKEKHVTLSNGAILSYTNLVLATGGDPRVLPFPGKDLKNIFVMRNVEDANYVEKAIAAVEGRKPDVVIVGSSFIGMEAASILAKIANVSVIGMEKYPFERVLGAQVGQAMMKLNQHNGIKLLMEKFVEKYGPSESDATKVGSVILKDGTSIPCDFVILGAGVIPQTSYLKDAGITIDRDGGISVNASMMVPGVENVFAIGDIARYPYHLTGENVRVEHWNVAQNQARTVAKVIVSKLTDPEAALPVFKHIPYFWTVQFGKSIRYVGHATSFDEAVVQGSTELDATGGGLSFVVYYCRKGEVVAVCSLAKDPVVSHASELMRLKKMPSVKAIKDGLDLLTVPLLCNTF
jgi:NADPH-dependent 2,4-dienoyl-CoA reductase/sulfur reductase-like enzyme/nitrite reductase/ring-hydroxylating ferredoxin subunit